MKKLFLICALGLALAFATGCQHPGARFDPYTPIKLATTNAIAFQGLTVTNQVSSDLLQPPSQLFTLGPGDRLEIEVMGDPTSRSVTAVGPDGKIYFNLLPGMDVWGLTLPEAEAMLEKELAQYFRNQQPRVSLTLRAVESRRLWVLGRVQSPGIYYMTNNPTLLEALALAGGMLNYTVASDLSAVGANDDTGRSGAQFHCPAWTPAAGEF